MTTVSYDPQLDLTEVILSARAAARTEFVRCLLAVEVDRHEHPVRVLVAVPPAQVDSADWADLLGAFPELEAEFPTAGSFLRRVRHG